MKIKTVYGKEIKDLKRIFKDKEGYIILVKENDVKVKIKLDEIDEIVNY